MQEKQLELEVCFPDCRFSLLDDSGLSSRYIIGVIILDPGG